MKVIKYIAIVAAALAIAGCSKWTEQEPVEVLYPTLKDKNPELYAQYMESIRGYRASEHQVLIAKFDNKQTVPAGRADHIDCLPDSVDFVILNNPDNLSDAIIAEMAFVRQEKAMKVLVRHFNRKFFEGDDPSALTWARWFFPIVNQTEGLREIDHCLQYNLRFVATGRHNKANYRISYAQLKQLGYRSLVHEFYSATSDIS